MRCNPERPRGRSGVPPFIHSSSERPPRGFVSQNHQTIAAISPNPARLINIVVNIESLLRQVRECGDDRGLNSRNRLALLTTVTEDIAMAAAATMGFNRVPKKG